MSADKSNQDNRPYEPILVTDDSFNHDVMESDLPVVVDFYAKWCGPCRTIAPTLDQLASEFKGKLVVAKIDIDKNPVSTAHMAVQGIPHLLFVHKGKVLKRAVGNQPKAKLQAEFDAFVKSVTQS